MVHPRRHNEASPKGWHLRGSNGSKGSEMPSLWRNNSLELRGNRDCHYGFTISRFPAWPGERRRRPKQSSIGGTDAIRMSIGLSCHRHTNRFDHRAHPHVPGPVEFVRKPNGNHCGNHGTVEYRGLPNTAVRERLKFQWGSNLEPGGRQRGRETLRPLSNREE